jgi:hypothetical protein
MYVLGGSATARAPLGPVLRSPYAARRADLLAMAQELFDVVLSGAVKVVINHTTR